MLPFCNSRRQKKVPRLGRNTYYGPNWLVCGSASTPSSHTHIHTCILGDFVTPVVFIKVCAVLLDSFTREPTTQACHPTITETSCTASKLTHPCKNGITAKHETKGISYQINRSVVQKSLYYIYYLLNKHFISL